MRTLYLTTLHPGARLGGGEIVSQEFVAALRAGGHDVAVLGYRRSGSFPPLGTADVVVGERPIETGSAGMRPVGWMLRALVSRRPYSAAKYVSTAYRRAVAAAIERHAPRLVVLEHAQMAWLLPTIGAERPYVHLAHNVEHALYRQVAGAGGRAAPVYAREARLMRAVERRLSRTARQVWTLTAEDRQAFVELGAGDVRTFGVPVAPGQSGGAAATRGVVLLGSWTWGPNAAGLEWFLTSVLPLLGNEADVHVGGGGGERLLDDRPNVTVHGRVEDAAAFLRSARVVVVPAVSGGGVQVKTLDAIASGRRVVATPVALRGIEDVPPGVTVAEDPQAFSDAIRRSLLTGADGTSEGALAWSAARRAGFERRLAAAVDEAAS